MPDFCVTYGGGKKERKKEHTSVNTAKVTTNTVNQLLDRHFSPHRHKAWVGEKISGSLNFMFYIVD